MLRLFKRIKSSLWEYGTCNGRVARRHKINGNVQFVNFKKGDQKEIDGVGHLEDKWINFDSSWWGEFRLGRQIVDISVINTNVNEFGKTKQYSKGDIVVWRGNTPCIGRIGMDVDFSKAECHIQECGRLMTNNAFGHFNPYNSLHYKHLRPATEAEVEYLGNNIIIILGNMTQ